MRVLYKAFIGDDILHHCSAAKETLIHVTVQVQSKILLGHATNSSPLNHQQVGLMYLEMV